jgi:two-component system phosphate regulon sensor histidine kinase PhoR
LFDAFEKVKIGGIPMRITLYLEDLQNAFSHFYAVTLAPLRKLEDGSIYGITSAFHDITEIKRAEQIRIDFIGNASHELRTPITTIKGYAETILEDLSQGNLDGNSKKFLEIILRNADRLTSLVEDMMEIHSLEHDPDLNFEEILVREITQQVIGDLAVAADNKSQTIEFNCEGINSIFADRLKLEQVLKNLIGNAIKYSPAGSTIKVIWCSTEEGVPLLKTIDNGPGIPEQHLARLFERFYRVDRGRSRDQGGTGLGLAIVKHIMQTHGGSVNVKSTLGVGSEFVCSFPTGIENVKA